MSADRVRTKVASGSPSSSRPRASNSSKTPVSAAASAVASSRMRVWTRSTVRSELTSPIADATPAAHGTTTDWIPKAAASRATCIGPAPPNPTRVKPRGSMPRWTVTTRIAEAIVALTISWIACAAPVTSISNGAPTDWSTAAAASAASSVTPPARPAGSR